MFFYQLVMEINEELKSLRKRPMCWLAIGFLLIICIFFVGRSYRDILYQEDIGTVYLEGKIIDKDDKPQGVGADLSHYVGQERQLILAQLDQAQPLLEKVVCNSLDS